MNRRELLQRSAAVSLAAAVPFSFASTKTSGDANSTKTISGLNPLKPPIHGPIPVAFLISQGAAVIDFCGPWEVFQDVSIPEHRDQGFHLYTVAETSDPIEVSGGMKVTPNYTLKTAPQPKVVVIPAQAGDTDAMLDWIRRSAKSADVVMSVCTGAYLLAETGLLAGKAATTHHNSYRAFGRRFQDVQLKRGVRFVEQGNLATAGGLTSGIDLALRVVERYYGRDVAKQTAYYMEYQGQGWMNESSNSVYANVDIGDNHSPFCPVCGMDVDPKTAEKSVYNDKTYYFCMPQHKQQFDATPQKFVKAS